ncbi:hypothetical protein R4172_05210 [Rhodococcus kroppenstedtii]|uniref:hypothetical protein n=1 Tax=Rhodococcoides kroppenstedtii TaxID=293050 RepID=UPI002954216F|nr:hypothetical protein [Rhodococcus kroppenstedtii]MDV7196960.1 hypothetical protein [Rhodococcus kroppenstedtii]
MRITVIPSARAHGITDNEIRAVMSFYVARIALTPRMVGAQPFLYIAPAADGEPWIEVIADLRDPEVAVVFHAMMLRHALVANLELDQFITPIYSRQRR